MTEEIQTKSPNTSSHLINSFLQCVSEDIRDKTRKFQAGRLCPSSLLLLSCYIMSDSSRSHGLQHTRFPYPPLSPAVGFYSFLLSQ